MRTTFVVALAKIRLSAKLGRGDRVDDVTFITNELEHVEKLLPSQFERVVGTLETNFIRNAPAIVYSKGEMPDNMDPLDYLDTRLLLLSTLLSMMWVVKDNAVNFDLAYLISESSGGRTRIDSNSRKVKYSTAEGLDHEVKFSRRELQRARNYLRERVSTTRFLNGDTSVAIVSPERIERFTYFVSGARAAQDVGLKVANYCTSLEALFATGRTELTHRLAERVAVFLEDEAQARSDIYDSIKRAYSIRSIVIHGAATKESRESRFLEGARQLDDIVRRTYARILDTPQLGAIFDLDQPAFDNAFNLLVFGRSWEMVMDGIAEIRDAKT